MVNKILPEGPPDLAAPAAFADLYISALKASNSGLGPFFLSDIVKLIIRYSKNIVQLRYDNINKPNKLISNSIKIKICIIISSV